MRMHASDIELQAIILVSHLLLLHVRAMPLVPGMFMFGDSSLDVGTNSFIQSCTITANFLPYGESHFSPPTGRFSDGLLIPDLLGQLLGLPDFAPPFIKPGAEFGNGINFASAGSGLLPTTRVSEDIISIDEQVQQFVAIKPHLHSRYGSSMISDSIYILSGGGNDLGSYLANSTAQTNVPFPEFIAQLLQKVKDNVQIIYGCGARKVVVMLLAPLGCMPFLRARVPPGPISGCVDSVNLATLAYNGGVAEIVMEIRAAVMDLHLIYVDPYEKVYEYVNQGASYGFTQSSLACCGSGAYNGVDQCGTKDVHGNSLTTVCPKQNLSQYVFFDNFHPTELVYSLLVQSAFDHGNQSIAHPIDIQTLALL